MLRMSKSSISAMPQVFGLRMMLLVVALTLIATSSYVGYLLCKATPSHTLQAWKHLPFVAAGSPQVTGNLGLNDIVVDELDSQSPGSSGQVVREGEKGKGGNEQLNALRGRQDAKGLKGKGKNSMDSRRDTAASGNSVVANDKHSASKGNHITRTWTTGDKNGAKIQVVLTVGKNYVNMFLNWWAISSRHMAKIQHDVNFLILCFDEPSARVVHSLGMVCFQMPNAGKVEVLWWARMLKLKSLIDDGYTVILTDSDAFWVGNPLPVLDVIDTDIVASPGNAFGKPFFCMGWITLRSTPSTRMLLSMVVKGGNKIRDDQKATNEEMRASNARDHGPYWQYRNFTQGREVLEEVQKQSMFGTFGDEGTYTRLTPRVFDRNCSNMADAHQHGIVMHCLAPAAARAANVKQSHYLKNALWVIKDSAYSILADSSTHVPRAGASSDQTMCMTCNSPKMMAKISFERIVDEKRWAAFDRVWLRDRQNE